jgi:uncharacterized protein (TIGR00288 family)
MISGERSELALFIDFENIALGLDTRKDQTFEIQRVLERLLEKGKVIVKRAYADWSRFSAFTRSFHEAAIELIEIPKRRTTGKNSADIRLCVDAMDLCYSKEHIDTFVIVSGDSDFSPLVSKLRENSKHVIGLGLKGSTSELLVSNCDEFIFYESLAEPQRRLGRVAEGALPKDKADILRFLANTVVALVREGRDPIQTSLVKDTIKRKQPSFNEGDYGYRSFTDMLADAQVAGLVKLREDPRSGTHIVELVPSLVPLPRRPPQRPPRRRASPAAEPPPASDAPVAPEEP